MSRRKTINRLTAAALENMTDQQLADLVGDGDYSGFSDQELQAVVSGTASPALLARVEAASKAPA